MPIEPSALAVAREAPLGEMKGLMMASVWPDMMRMTRPVVRSQTLAVFEPPRKRLFESVYWRGQLSVK